MTTSTQARQQENGVHRPTTRMLAAMLDGLSGHERVVAVTINGRVGRVFIETEHEGLVVVNELSIYPVGYK